MNLVRSLTKAQILGAIRRLFARSQKVKYIRECAICKTKKGPRGGKMYKCAMCNKCYPAKDTQVDHIDEVVPLDKTLNDMDYNEIIERLDCDLSNLQLLCKTCHNKKTQEENKIRRKNKNDRKRKKD